jgi:Ca2+-binding RTX toxin-like protein
MTDIPANTFSKAAMEGASGFFVEVGSFSGTLEKQGDHDWIRVELSPSTYQFYLAVIDRGSAINGASILYLRDASGTLVATGTPGTGANAVLSYTPADFGTYFVEVYTPGGPVSDYSLFATRVPAANKTLSDNADAYTGLGGERVLGGKGDDTIDVGLGVDALGEQGNDTLFGGANFCRLVGGIGRDTLVAGSGGALMFGDAGNDTVTGSAVSDGFYGGGGKDILTGGGDSDQFRFASHAHSKVGKLRDVITDFVHGEDFIDLEQIDAKSGGADSAFHWIRQLDFHHRKGELRYDKVNNPGQAHDKTIIAGDINGDGRPDFQIELTGLITLSKGDFVL